MLCTIKHVQKGFFPLVEAVDVVSILKKGANDAMKTRDHVFAVGIWIQYFVTNETFKWRLTPNELMATAKKFGSLRNQGVCAALLYEQKS